jgi:plasmid stabilization system protein ParE
MSYNVVLQAGAESDIEAAYIWYENQQVGLGEQFLNELVVYYEKLMHNPTVFKWVNKMYRQAILSRFPFVIIYRVIEADVVIYAVFHTSKNPKTYL